MGIPIIGAPAPEAVAAMNEAQVQALENLFQGACGRAKEMMRSQQRANHALFNVEGPEAEVLLAGMGAAALYAAQQFIAPVVQTFSLRIKKLEDEKKALEASVAQLEKKIATP